MQDAHSIAVLEIVEETAFPQNIEKIEEIIHTLSDSSMFEEEVAYSTLARTT